MNHETETFPSWIIPNVHSSKKFLIDPLAVSKWLELADLQSQWTENFILAFWSSGL